MALHNHLSFLLCGVACLTLLTNRLSAEETDLRLSLERVYQEWRSALLARNLTAWRTCTTTYRQVLTRNLIVSQKQRYPDAVFALPVTPPDVRKLALMETEAVGDTGHLIFFGKIDLGISEEAADVPDNLIVLKFFREQGLWKFDSSRFLNLADNIELRDACRRGSTEWAKHSPFNPPGTLPAVPKLCKEPEKVSALRIQAYGYEVLANVNGYDNTPVFDSAEQQLIIGGLLRGENALKLQVKELPIEKDDERFLQVEAVLVNNDEAKPTIRVFEWTPKEQPVPPVVNLTITINNLTQKGI